MTWPAEGIQVYSQAKPLAFSAGLMQRDGSRQEHRALPPAPALGGVSWASQGWEIPASPAQLCREALDKVNLARFKGSFLLWMGLKCPELTHTYTSASGLLLAKWGPRWVLPKTPEQGHCHGKGLQTEPTQGCTALHSSCKCTEL